MDPHLQLAKQKICTNHNQPIVLVNSDPKIGACCVICLQLQPGNVPIEQFNQSQQAIYDKLYKKIVLDHQLFQSLLDQLLRYKQSIIFDIDKIIQVMLDQIQIIVDQKIKLTSILQSDRNQTFIGNNIEQISQKQTQINENVLNQGKIFFQSLQQKYGQIEKILHSLSNCQSNYKGDNPFQLTICPKDFEYQLIKKSRVREKSYCRSFAFNKDQTVLLVACEKEIIVYKFINGYVSNQLQRLSNHTRCINCLYFMKLSNSFISGSQDNTIIIWVLDQNKKWIAEQVLKKHINHIYCILMNKFESLLISGGQDNALKFWSKSQQSWKFWTTNEWTCQQSISTKHAVWNVSLNEMEDKLIIIENNFNTLPHESSIQFLMQKDNQQWSIVQTINFNRWGWRLCFIIEDQFVFATENACFIEIYDYDAYKKEFKKLSQINVQNCSNCNGFFPCQFIKPLNIFTFKFGRFLNIIRVNEKCRYNLIQTIDFADCYLFGGLTDDGNYLATWDWKSKEISFRKITQLEEITE